MAFTELSVSKTTKMLFNVSPTYKNKVQRTRSIVWTSNRMRVHSCINKYGAFYFDWKMCLYLNFTPDLWIHSRRNMIRNILLALKWINKMTLDIHTRCLLFRFLIFKMIPDVTINKHTSTDNCNYQKNVCEWIVL